MVGFFLWIGIRFFRSTAKEFGKRRVSDGEFTHG